MPLIATLLTCHNRKKQTLQCLHKLYSCQIPPGYTLDTFIVDDGSTDGTAAEIIKTFPKVKIIFGDGSLFWNRGMHLAWKTAIRTKDYDYYLWLNDDTILNIDTLSVLLNSAELFKESIIVGTTCSENDPKIVTYGGRTQKAGLIIPTDVPIPCNYFNGNLVLFPKYVYSKVGLNDPIFHHGFGDFDYGMRAAKIGIKSYVAPGVLGKCNLNSSIPAWCDTRIAFMKRLKAFRTPLGRNPEEYFIFDYRHKGIILACFHYITIHLRLCFPWIWEKKTN